LKHNRIRRAAHFAPMNTFEAHKAGQGHPFKLQLHTSTPSLLTTPPFGTRIPRQPSWPAGTLIAHTKALLGRALQCKHLQLHWQPTILQPAHTSPPVLALTRAHAGTGAGGHTPPTLAVCALSLAAELAQAVVPARPTGRPCLAAPLGELAHRLTRAAAQLAT